MKKVSVVICTYNGEKFLREQLDSVLAQTYPLYEIIIQDDGSTDATLSIAAEYQKHYPQLIHIYENEIHNGWNINFLDAIHRATGDYIACCDQDDVWEKDKIETQIREIGDNWLHVCSSNIWNGDTMTPRYSNPGTIADVFLRYYYSGHEFLISKEMMPFIPVGIDIDISHDRFLPIVAIYKNKLVTSHYLGIRWRRYEGTATGQQEHESTKKSGVGKVLYAMRHLISRKTSPVIKRGMEKYVKTLTCLDETDGSYPIAKTYIRLFDALAKQTVGSYIRATKYLYQLHDEIWPGVPMSAGLLYTICTYPYRWWYEFRNDI